MKRHRHNQILNISLLPFLSILACLLGVLTLMITGISFGQMEETQKTEVVVHTKEYSKIRSEVFALKKEIEKIELNLANASVEKKKLDDQKKHKKEKRGFF